MLVLTRRRGEAIVIGENITVRVLEVSGDQIRLGIEAPRSVTVHREEIFQEIQSENRAAVTAPPNARPERSAVASSPARPVGPASLPARPKLPPPPRRQEPPAQEAEVPPAG